jgi:hypothetical protein
MFISQGGVIQVDGRGRNEFSFASTDLDLGTIANQIYEEGKGYFL